MTLPKEASGMTRAEFLAWEEEQPTKHEFVGGEVFAMVGARQIHVVVAGNCFALLKTHLRGRPCRALISDMKLEVKSADAVFYPDVMVTCDLRDLRAERTLHHPTVITANAAWCCGRWNSRRHLPRYLRTLRWMNPVRDRSESLLHGPWRTFPPSPAR